MAVTMGITATGISATIDASNTKALDILTRAATELSMVDVGTATNQQIADFIVAEWRKHITHLARRNEKAVLQAADISAVDTDTDFDWDEV